VSIATRRGDAGTTDLLRGQRVPKDHPQVEALGAFDALNVEIGAARLASQDPAARELMLKVQACLVALMGEVACAEEDAAGYEALGFKVLREEDLALLDTWTAAIEAKSVRFEGWATPGSTAEALAFERARVSARTAERRLVAVAGTGRRLRPLVHQWTNRLSDVLWLLAREAETSRPGP
jgi:cob(I)alamin adenosyltransferase